MSTRTRHRPFRAWHRPVPPHRCRKVRFLHRMVLGSVGDRYVFWCDEDDHAVTIPVTEFWGATLP